MKVRTVSGVTLIATALGVLCLVTIGSAQQRAVAQPATVQGMIEPDAPSEADTLAAQVSPARHAALVESYLQERERQAAWVDNNPAHPQGLPLTPGRQTDVISAETEVVNPQLLVIGRNSKNTNANNAALASTLAEPAAANNALHVFAAGNFNHAEFSVDGGTTWANVPLPGGPADAPI